MIQIENVDIFGWEAAIRGARRPMNSLDRSDAWFLDYWNTEYEEMSCHSLNVDYSSMNETGDLNEDGHSIWEMRWMARKEGTPAEQKECNLETAKVVWPYPDDFNEKLPVKLIIGPADHKLLMNLAKGGSEEAKWRRMVHVQMDILAPLYWWKEFETYKVGTVSNSSSTMHKIHAKPFELDDFSYDHLLYEDNNENAMLRAHIHSEDYLDDQLEFPVDLLCRIIDMLNQCRTSFNVTKDKKYWWQMIQLLPSSYNQRRTIDLNYEVLAKQYRERKEHKLDEWRQYCEWIKTLPYSELITLEEAK